MMTKRSFLLAPVFALTLIAGAAQAASFTNTTGLVPPHSTETFDSIAPANYTPAGSLFSGMTFGSNMYVNKDFSGVPGFAGNGIANFYSPIDGVIPTTVTFSTPVSAAAFSVLTNPTTPGSSTFIASLGSSPVEVYSVLTCVPGIGGCPAVSQYVGFTGITFDKITFIPAGVGEKMVIDNLQIAAIPEPETYAMMLAGLGLLGFVARRRKQEEKDVAA